MGKQRDRGERGRRALLRHMTEDSQQGVEKVIRFVGNGVPDFLSKLDEFEAVSRKKRLVIQ